MATKVCPAVKTETELGWYDKDGNLISSSGIDPSTGKPWTGEQLISAASTGASSTVYGLEAWPEGMPTTMAEYNAIRQTPEYQKLVSSYGVNPVTGAPCAGGAATTPGAFDGANVPAPAVTPAPEVTLSPEQLAWQESISGYLSSTLEQGGRGIPEETMAQMTQKTTDTLKAKEAEDIRVMRNNMERRGITNSGFVFSNEQKIRSNTTVAIANSITDLNIQNALMKLSSFETAMGQAAQFLGYLGEMSQLKYQPKYQTWAAQQQANLYQYQAKMDLYKTQLQQAYTVGNMELAGQIAAEAAAQGHEWDVELTQMEIDAANQQAAAEGAGSLLGTTIGGIFGML